MHQVAVLITVIGRVQGVGFRPFIFAIANEFSIKGTVQNNMDGVYIHAESSEKNINSFLEAIVKKAPRLSRILEVKSIETEYKGFNCFSIIESSSVGNSQIVIPIDAAVCPECVEEMKNPQDFRYGYAFINCTQCGPRYTIIKDLPYDRPYTTMSEFKMCPTCKKEYEDIHNRRHHAQPIACPTCGPQLTLLNTSGDEISTSNPVVETINLLKEGKIIAIKGIGGFHLCCDATNEKAVSLLRNRKNRPAKPFAVMASSLAKIKEIAVVSEKEASLLSSSEAPIVVLKQNASYCLAPSIAHNLSTIGIMLPYAPLHYLLVDDKNLPFIVATSANMSGQPLIYENEIALRDLNKVVDFYLVHNRDILRPIDDSVLQVNDGDIEFFRRARGFVPDPILTEQKVHNLMALGSIQKNTFTLGRNNQVFIGPHIGDLTNYETVEHFQKMLALLKQWVTLDNPLIIKEKHPQFPIRELVGASKIDNVLEVQHHHAHMAGCMVENKLEEAWGIILDGTGYGDDGAIWGFELFYGTVDKVQRKGHLAYWPLIGGDKAVKEPWRNTVTLVAFLFGEEAQEILCTIFPDRVPEIQLLLAGLQNNLNVSLVGTCGRLFDAISALLGVCTNSSYDGQAAIELAELVDESKIYIPYPIEMVENDLIEIKLKSLVQSIYLDRLANVSIQEISGRFHETIVHAIVQMVMVAKQNNNHTNNRIVLSGGSLHNRYLKKRLRKQLRELGFEVFFHKELPCSDGGLSYGQLMVAANKKM